MERLFLIREYRKGPVVRGKDGKVIYFANKMEAKKFRDELGNPAVVSFGPDHRETRQIRRLASLGY
jgi:hypothetical protein